MSVPLLRGVRGVFSSKMKIMILTIIENIREV
jgi:hypothetical protein